VLDSINGSFVLSLLCGFPNSLCLWGYYSIKD
jgi:hypothetical protein